LSQAHSDWALQFSEVTLEIADLRGGAARDEKM